MKTARDIRTEGVEARAEWLDLTGEVCPYTFVKAKLVLEGLPHGAVLRVRLDHAKAVENVPRAMEREGHEVAPVREVAAGLWEIEIVKVER